jgi:cell division control protein 6
VVHEILSESTIFRNEELLSVDYVPSKLPHRDEKLKFLARLFRFTIERPGLMSQKVLITGDVGTGKTASSQRFGIDLMKTAKDRRVNLHYIHVNCREYRGSLFLILKRVISEFIPNFSQRGYSSEELLERLANTLDRIDAFAVLTLDELESLIKTEGTEALYKLTRIQEGRLDKPPRLSFIFILRDVNYLSELDRSTLSTLQRNIIEMKNYSREELLSILSSRVELAFAEDIVPDESVTFVAELASARGDARYAIDLLWRAGKYAESDQAKELTPEHVRKAVATVYPVLRADLLETLADQERIVLLAIARILESSGEAYVAMGEVEESYRVVCEEIEKKSRAHTAIWKHVRQLAAFGLIETKTGEFLRGRTTFVSISIAPASLIRRSLEPSVRTSSKKIRKNQQLC